MPFKIAIIGAGPAGTLLASLLSSSHSTSSITLFESDSSFDSRFQGGTLDLHTDGGQLALKKAGLYEQFLKHARFDGEAIAFADKDLLVYMGKGPSTQKRSWGRPEIDRVRLRELLLDAVPKEWMRWGRKVVGVEEEKGERGTWAVRFADGVEGGFDLVVGADGAWSKVRPVLTDVRPCYSGVKGVRASIRDAEKRYPELHKLVNRGSLFTYSDGKSINVQQLGDGSLNIGEWGVRAEDWGDDLDLSDWEGVKKVLLEEYHDWAPELRRFLEVADGDNAVCKGTYMLPIGHRWDHRPGLTLIGDAAHLMTPFAGVGVNLALEDSMKLAHAIIEAEKSGHAQDLDLQVKAFEEDMFKKATKVQKLTWANVEDMFFTPGAPRTVVASYTARAILDGDDSLLVLRFLVHLITRTYFGIFKLFW